MTTGTSYTDRARPDPEDTYLSYRLNPKKQDIRFFWKDDEGRPIRSFQNLQEYVKKNGKNLVFAMNGGMYKTDHSPLGLFIQEHQTMTRINRADAKGNFYLKPNGIFYLTDHNKAVIEVTDSFRVRQNVRFATQSGPMLLVDGKIHPAFRAGSSNLNIRNGVGILPDGNILFALSRTDVNFYDFAMFFKKAGCRNALYLDGFVSRAYLPSQHWIQHDGDFGVIIAEVNDLGKK